MNTIQIYKSLNSDPFIKLYSPKVYALDEFLKKANKRSAKRLFIVNDEVKSKPGNHWILIVMEYDKVIFFDSFARPAEQYGIKEKLNTMNRTIISNKIVLQNPLSDVCGHFCIFFAYHLCRNKELNQLLTYFSKDLKYNDESVYNFVTKVFSKFIRTNDNI